MARTKIADPNEEETRQLSIKLSASLLERVEAHALKMRKQHGFTNVARVEAIRSLLTEALALHETTAPAGP